MRKIRFSSRVVHEEDEKSNGKLCERCMFLKSTKGEEKVGDQKEYFGTEKGFLLMKSQMVGSSSMREEREFLSSRRREAKKVSNRL